MELEVNSVVSLERLGKRGFSVVVSLLFFIFEKEVKLLICNVDIGVIYFCSNVEVPGDFCSFSLFS